MILEEIDRAIMAPHCIVVRELRASLMSTNNKTVGFCILRPGTPVLEVIFNKYLIF